MKKKITICQMSSAHPRFDTRIYRKICKSLVKNYDVYLIVADGKGDQLINNIKILDVGKPNNRFERVFLSSFKVFFKSLSIKANIYHFHDPELIIFGLILRFLNLKVIYDVHENYYHQFKQKYYLNFYIGNLMGFIFKIFEKTSYLFMSGISVATHDIGQNFKKHKNVVILENFPNKEKIRYIKNFNTKNKFICYAGTISSDRGIFQILNALLICKTNVKLNLCGSFSNEKLKNIVLGNKRFKRVFNYYGELNYENLKKIYKKSHIGLVLFKPLKNHNNALPNKFWEYLMFGLPLLCTNFKYWQTFLKKYQIGYSVSYENVNQIAKKIDILFENKNIKNLKISSRNGIKNSLSKFNWEKNEKKLKKLYSKTLT